MSSVPRMHLKVQFVFKSNKVMPRHPTNTIRLYSTGPRAVLGSVAQSCLTLCDLMDCSPPGFSVHGDSPGKNTGVGCHALIQGIFPTWGLRSLLHCGWIVYCLATRETHDVCTYFNHKHASDQIRSGQSLSRVRLFATP